MHGALLDAQLLAQVYVELSGGRQIGLGLAVAAADAILIQAMPARPAPRPARHFAASPLELAAHAKFMESVKEPLWGAKAFG
jgi:DNA polymerase-3 subunit epsilon